MEGKGGRNKGACLRYTLLEREQLFLQLFSFINFGNLVSLKIILCCLGEEGTDFLSLANVVFPSRPQSPSLKPLDHIILAFSWYNWAMFNVNFKVLTVFVIDIDL